MKTNNFIYLFSNRFFLIVLVSFMHKYRKRTLWYILGETTPGSILVDIILCDEKKMFIIVSSTPYLSKYRIYHYLHKIY